MIAETHSPVPSGRLTPSVSSHRPNIEGAFPARPQLGPVRIVLATKASVRINSCCFRTGTTFMPPGRYREVGHYIRYPLQKAGNFLLWGGWDDMVRSGFIQDKVRPWVEREVTRRQEKRQISAALDAGRVVGWASSVPLSTLDATVLSTLENRRVNSDNIRADYITDLTCMASPTQLVTINAQIRPDFEMPGKWICCIYNIYPGPCLGSFVRITADPAKNNITTRTGLALFDWDHPAVPL